MPEGLPFLRVFPFRRRPAPRTVHEVLEDLGVPQEEIEQAEADGTDELLAIDRLVFRDPARYTVAEAAQALGISVDDLRATWRALGFALASDDEPSFSDRDLETLDRLGQIVEGETGGFDRSLQLARVLGLSMARFAAAVIDLVELDAAGRRGVDADDDPDAWAHSQAASLAVRAGDVLPLASEALDYVFRRHLQAAARRQIALATAIHAEGQCIGFADLVRFTAISQQLDSGQLAAMVKRFDEVTNDVVVGQGGRIVKMIGDEAMFAVIDPIAAGYIALELAHRFERADHLPGVRVGVAAGAVLSRDGDLYGPVVNLASRLVELGPSGSVNVSASMRDALAGNPAFKVRSLGVRRLRHLGAVRVYRLRAGPGWPADAEAPPTDRASRRKILTSASDA